MNEVVLALIIVACAVLIWLAGSIFYAIASNDSVPFNVWIPMPRYFPGMPISWPVWVGLVALEKIIERVESLTRKLAAMRRVK